MERILKVVPTPANSQTLLIHQPYSMLPVFSVSISYLNQPNKHLLFLIFIAYWPRSDASNPTNAANLFAATGGGYGLGTHPSLPFGLLPPTSGRGVPSYPSSTTAAAAYSNAYTNTLSVAASQAASLGIPAASKLFYDLLSVFTVINLQGC